MEDQPLTEIRVLDLTNHITGSFCTKQFADYGAEVIKIEKVGQGCHTRRMVPFVDDRPGPDRSLYHLYLNANKKSVTLNLKTDTGKKIFRNLIKETDILVESFRPRVMRHLGLDYDSLEAVNPKLVMASISNFGQTGPYRDLKASELVLYAMGGAMSSTGLPDLAPINKARDACLLETGLQAWYAILGVYMGTRLDGIGDYIDLSIMETQLAGCERRTSHLLTYQYTGDISLRVDPFNKIGIAPRMQMCKDGYVNLVVGPSKFQKFLGLIGKSELAEDPEWNILNLEKEGEATALFDSCFSQKTKQEWSEIFQDAGMICTPLSTPADVCQDSHWQEREFFQQMDHPQSGRITFPRGAIRTTPEWWRMKRPAPVLGQDNEKIFGGLGYTAEDLTILHAGGII